MKRFNSLRLRILSACIIFALTVNICFGLFLNIAFETGEDTLFNWQIASHTEHLRSLYLQDPSQLQHFDTEGLWQVGTDQQILTHLNPALAGQEKLVDSSLIDDYVVTTPQGFKIYEYRHGPKAVHIVRAPLPAKEAAAPEYFYYLVDISGFSSSETDNLWKIILSILISGLITLGLALITGLGVTHFVVAPLTRLKKDLDTLDFNHQHQLTNHYYQDEVGSVAEHINALLKRVKHLVEREKNFTRDASHELRTPVTNIAMALELISFLPDKSPKLQRPLQRINRATRDMKYLIESFLQLGREESDQEASEMLELYSLVMRSFEKHHYLIEGKSVTLFNKVPDELKTRLPPNLLAILLDNLIRNACQYTDSGFIEITGNDDSLQIRDSGPGFREHTISSMLEPWQKGHASGLGLGLNIVSRICQSRGWHLDINNWQEGEHGGTLIRVIFSHSDHMIITS